MINAYYYSAKQALLRRLMESRVQRAGSREAPRPGSLLLLATSNEGSLGDEAILTTVIDEYISRGTQEVTLVAYAPWPQWTRFGTMRSGTAIRYESLYHIRDMLRFAHYLSEHEHFVLPGADVIDGAYAKERSLLRITCARIAAQAGCRSSILGFSFREKPQLWAVEELLRLPAEVRLTARDPVSCERAARILGRDVVLTADPAFLLRPESVSRESKSAEAWMASQRRMSRHLVGLNANSAGTEAPVDAVVAAYKQLIEGFGRDRHDAAFVFVPHDYRGRNNDDALAARVVAALDPVTAERCYVAKGINAAEVKHLCGQLDLTVTGRMHVAIASMGQGTPSACLAYQGKFEGLMMHFGLDDLIMQPSDAWRDGGLASFALDAFNRRNTVRKRIASHLDNVMALARSNFSA
jgi:polysaccharide pyruvyl transferase WcaK-like protein